MNEIRLVFMKRVKSNYTIFTELLFIFFVRKDERDLSFAITYSFENNISFFFFVLTFTCE